ncbi:MAG: hypothetical protein GXY34_05170 [Syntrophomonadaceae bacterium]|nr:hypothetical protein [Syntrophomonadaceae bacterium]
MNLTAAEQVKGFNKLSEAHKQIFKDFLKNWYGRWDHPENHQPLRVGFKRDKSAGAYLRVDMSDGDWYHVKSAITFF